MMKLFKALILIPVLLLGTACDPPTKSEPKVEQPVNRRLDQMTKLMTLSSAVGALQHCEHHKLYEGKPSIVEDSFYRLATIMRAFTAGNDEELQALARMAHVEYIETFKGGTLTEYSVGSDGRVANKDTKMEGPATCQKAETILKAERGPGKILDVPAAKPITKGQDARTQVPITSPSHW